MKTINLYSPFAKRNYLALATILTLLLSTVGCSTNKLQQVANKSAAVVTFIQTEDPISQILAEKLITDAEAAAIRTKFQAFTSAYLAWDAQLNQTLKADPRASLASLAPDFAALILKLNDTLAIHFGDAKAQLRLEQALGIVRLAVAFIAAFFTAQLKQAQQFLEHERPAIIERALMAHAGIRYDAKRLAEARKMLRSPVKDARAKAVCFYLDIPVEVLNLAHAA
jgi:hypothetical protein